MFVVLKQPLSSMSDPDATGMRPGPKIVWNFKNLLANFAFYQPAFASPLFFLDTSNHSNMFIKSLFFSLHLLGHHKIHQPPFTKKKRLPVASQKKQMGPHISSSPYRLTPPPLPPLPHPPFPTQRDLGHPCFPFWKVARVLRKKAKSSATSTPVATHPDSGEGPFR